MHRSNMFSETERKREEVEVCILSHEGHATMIPLLYNNNFRNSNNEERNIISSHTYFP